MMLTLFALVSVLGTPIANMTVGPQASQHTPIIDVVMVGPGNSFYTAFGHTAVLIRPTSKTPVMKGDLYNFGVTALGDSDFMLKFLGGRAIFWGNIRPYAKQIKRWRRADRSVTRYRLQVTPDIARKVQARFRSMIQPKTREFVYDLFRQNCVTKVRDVINEFSDGLLEKSWRKEAVQMGTRQLAEIGYSNHPGAYFAFQWFPGRSLDVPTTAWFRSGEPSFFQHKLPSLSRPDGSKVVGPPVFDYRRTGAPPVGNPIYWFPISHTALIILLLGLAFFSRPKSNKLRSISVALGALLTGGYGCILLGVHLWTDWVEMKNNTLLLLAWPFDLVLLAPAVGLWRSSNGLKSWVQPYVQVHVVLSALLLASGLMIDALTGPVFPRLVLLSGWVFLARVIRTRHPI